MVGLATRLRDFHATTFDRALAAKQKGSGEKGNEATGGKGQKGEKGERGEKGGTGKGKRQEPEGRFCAIGGSAYHWTADHERPSVLPHWLREREAAEGGKGQGSWSTRRCNSPCPICGGIHNEDVCPRRRISSGMHCAAAMERRRAAEEGGA